MIKYVVGIILYLTKNKHRLVPSDALNYSAISVGSLSIRTSHYEQNLVEGLPFYKTVHCAGYLMRAYSGSNVMMNHSSCFFLSLIQESKNVKWEKFVFEALKNSEKHTGNSQIPISVIEDKFGHTTLVEDL